MLYDTVKKVIDNWDPIGLLPYAPKDEYDDESSAICEFIEEMKLKGEIDEQELAHKIYNVFSTNFGNDIFKSKFDECLDTALKIIEKESLGVSKDD